MDDDPAPVFQLIYASAATRPLDDLHLRRLLQTAHTRNAAVGVTGMLLYEAGSFLQVLEGDEAAVRAIFQRVSGDGRHTDVTLLFQGEVDERGFEGWSMGFARAPEHARERVQGWSTFLQTGFRGEVPEDADRARRLLYAFREGRWRRSA